MFVKVDGHEGYVKNTETGVELNVNKVEIEAARKRKALKKQQEEDINVGCRALFSTKPSSDFEKSL